MLLRKQSDLGLRCLPRPFWQAACVQNFRTFIIFTIPIHFGRPFKYSLAPRKFLNVGIRLGLLGQKVQSKVESSGIPCFQKRLYQA